MTSKDKKYYTSVLSEYIDYYRMIYEDEGSRELSELLMSFLRDNFGEEASPFIVSGRLARKLMDAPGETKQSFCDMIADFDKDMSDGFPFYICDECGEYFNEGYSVDSDVFVCSDKCVKSATARLGSDRVEETTLL